jgi:hypothetical protein
LDAEAKGRYETAQRAGNPGSVEDQRCIHGPNLPRVAHGDGNEVRPTDRLAEGAVDQALAG